MVYNPRELIHIPTIGIPTIKIGQTPLINMFGVTDKAYVIEETDEPNLLWENGSAMSWEDGQNILLEQQLVRKWLRERR